MMNAIEIQNLSYKFSDGTPALDNINLSIGAGAFVVIAGPNGSGKTTLLLHLNGLLSPTTGSVRVAGLLVSKNIRRVRCMVGMVFQSPESQIVGETVYDDIAFGPENLTLSRAEVQKRVHAAARRVQLDQYLNQRPHALSGGEKRRLAIAGVLAMQPQVIVLDEPLASLDYPGIRRVLKTILELHASGLTIIMATHDLEKVAAHTQRLIILDQGRIAADGPLSRVLKTVETHGVREPCASRRGMEIESWLS